ncbi:predicted protein [Chaetomium globosum CBS 148.51]|uniref:Uncharacterized protein n=1 Tax=Chaetomium globosum (strain ATCC 6205 / CBS 148.51 / DSM 1962 / NBRC 6347 / NRRL 1970) TaxID=306901 RepID=Q2H5B6_CHAGB|nr:uncharacterized protein CHGG_06149 [Chaetomium globosum CBS 148.51]EAQ89530.1 predicted protein [Chaetomium globosum CBS 148.51]
MARYSDSVTTIFTPDPTCFTSSNLWLPEVTYGCGTYYPPFDPRPTEAVKLSECDFPRLGPPPAVTKDAAHSACYQYNIYATGNTAYSDCPVGMTGAATDTRPWVDGVTIIETTCCPTAYDFKAPDGTPTAFPFVVDGTTYPGTFGTTNQCKATSIGALSGQVVTVTLSASPLSTTEVAWDYEQGFIAAEPAKVVQYLYLNEEAGTTSTCFGYRCPQSRPSPSRTRLVPTSAPTFAPTKSYIPPPSPVVTQFTPSPSCLSDSNFWIVSASCYLQDNISLASPPWLQCTYTAAGDPDPSDTACYQPGPSTVVSGTPAFYSACPVGYTAASETTTRPYGLPDYDDKNSTPYDVYATSKACCPSAFGDRISFRHTEVATTQTRGQNVFIYVVPMCVASSVSQLRDHTVTMGLYSDARVWDKKKRQGAEYGTTTAVWDVNHDLLYAHGQRVQWTVFHGTYTCYTNCNDYFTYSYHNTDPNYTPPTTTTTALASAEEMKTSTSIGEAAAVVKGDGQAGRLSVVMVIVTVVQVVVGALV